MICRRAGAVGSMVLLLLLSFGAEASGESGRLLYRVPDRQVVDCLVVGDSIAYGIGEFSTQCAAIAKSGITSGNWLASYGSSILPARSVVISLGTNDKPSAETYRNLVELRRRIRANRVSWVLPSAEKRPEARWYVTQVASAFRDTILNVPAAYLASDKIHLTGTGYRLFGPWLSR